MALIGGAIVGAATPFVQVAFECRVPQSEACVWGKSLLPVSVAVSTVVVGSIVAIAIFALLEWRRRANEKNDDV